jgi:aspartate beta-hydroxylase
LWLSQKLGVEERIWQQHIANVLGRLVDLEIGDNATDEAWASQRRDRLRKFLYSFDDFGNDPHKTHYPGLSETVRYDPSAFPIVESLEHAYPEINREINELGSDLYHSEGEGIAQSGNWDVFFFYERGRRNAANCARCPTIDRILREHDTLRTTAGLIYVSKLDGNTFIRPHKGPTNIRVRCHLGIKVPQGDCGMLCGGQLLKWETGKCIVFNDAAEHEVWNRTAEQRIVLIVDLWHPDLSSKERRMLKGLHNYAYLTAENLGRYWAINRKNKSSKGKGYD